MVRLLPRDWLLFRGVVKRVFTVLVKKMKQDDISSKKKVVFSKSTDSVATSFSIEFLYKCQHKNKV